MRLDKPLALDFETEPRPSALMPADPFAAPLFSIIDVFAERLKNEKRSLNLDGVMVFEQQDPFLPGKIALALSYWVCEYPANCEQTAKRCRYFRTIAEMMFDDPCESWGAQFYLEALCRLQNADLLDACLTGSTLQHLERTLCWTTFIDSSDYSLRNKPNNFYGVAYSIASSRAQLGWDDQNHADAIADRLISNYDKSSGMFGFPDESEGKGRFDRYSFLLSAEIALHFAREGKSLPNAIQQSLRQSAEYVLFNLNTSGEGFSYGRSIGAYGDSAFSEILSAAALYGLLTKPEIEQARAFVEVCSKRFLSFWFDQNTGAVNLWDNGRATEAYRGKHRILGETLGLACQHLSCLTVFHNLPKSEGQSAGQLWSPSDLYKHVKFLRGDYDYSLISFRARNRTFNLPLVNADSYFKSPAYWPAPFDGDLIQPSPESRAWQLVPELHMHDGRVLVPLSWYRSLSIKEETGRVVVEWAQNQLVDINAEEKRPGKVEGVSVETSIVFDKERLRRTDTFRFDFNISPQLIVCNFFSPRPFTAIGGARWRSESSENLEISFEGYDKVKLEKGNFGDSVKQNFAYEIRAKKALSSADKLIMVSWTLDC